MAQVGKQALEISKVSIKELEVVFLMVMTVLLAIY